MDGAGSIYSGSRWRSSALSDRRQTHLAKQTDVIYRVTRVRHIAWRFSTRRAQRGGFATVIDDMRNGWRFAAQNKSASTSLWRTLLAPRAYGRCCRTMTRDHGWRQTAIAATMNAKQGKKNNAWHCA